MLASPRSISRPTGNDKRAFRTAARRKSRRKNHPLLVWAGLEPPPPVAVAPPFDPSKLQMFATAIWRACSHPHTPLVERWFASHGLTLSDAIGIDVLRFHPSLKLHGDVRTAAMVWRLRDVVTDEPCGVSRMFLADDGALIRRKTLGRIYNTAVKLTADADVGTGLHITSTIERGIAAMSQGYRPLWVVSALADFPLLNGIEVLTIISDDDTDAQAVARRWLDAGREVSILNEMPPQVVLPCGGEFRIDDPSSNRSAWRRCTNE